MTKTPYPHRLAVLEMFVSALLLGSCHLSDDGTGPPEPQCVIQALETIAANSPTESVEIDVNFASPQRRSDVSRLLTGLDLRPFELNLLRGDDSVTIVGGFGSIERALDAAQVGEAAPLESCLSETSADDRLSQTVDEGDCEPRITRLKLRGPANAALAFREAAGSIATTSRIPSENEIIHLIQEQLRYAGDADTQVLDCA